MKAVIFLKEPFKTLWQNKDPFTEVSQIDAAAKAGDVFRHKEGRRTLRFRSGPNSYFLKHHSGVGWKEIFKNLLQLRLPVLSAKNEYEAAITLAAAGIDTLTPLAYGCRGHNPATLESFLVTTDILDTTSLEDVCRNWLNSPPPHAAKWALIKKVAAMAKIMHAAGINHRDFYICHFLLENSAAAKIAAQQDFRCYLIDLHRCQKRGRVPLRWLKKDLAGLMYSTMDAGLSRRDYLRFIKHYSGQPLRLSLSDPLWRDVLQDAQALYHKDFGKAPPRVFEQ